MHTCLNCGRTEGVIPLLQMTYKNATVTICPQCLPILIHNPEKLAEKLPGMDLTKSNEHHQA
jgi:hypothetical protein